MQEVVAIEKKLERIARDVRRLIVEIAAKSRSAHVGSSLSCVDLLVAYIFMYCVLIKMHGRIGIFLS